MNNLIFSICILILSSFIEAKSANIKTVKHVDIEKFMGKWYVLYSTPTFFDKHATNATETYYFDYETSKIEIKYQYNKKSFLGPKKVINQKAKIVKNTNAEWRVSLFGGLIKMPYYIIDLNPEYRYTVVASKNKKYFWILSRSASINPDTLKKINSRLELQNYNLKLLKPMNHHNISHPLRDNPAPLPNKN